ncbi:MAG: hypothetical protein ACREXK_02735 [Gammaproteobacteria bacterium]
MNEHTKSSHPLPIDETVLTRGTCGTSIRYALTIWPPCARSSSRSPTASPPSRRSDFPLLQRLALLITVGATRYPGIKIHDTRMIRLMEVLLHATTTDQAGF